MCKSNEAAPLAYHRLALITAPNTGALQFSDLLQSELSKIPDLELVERDQLQRISEELHLSTTLSAEDSADRLRLGALLHADALLFIDIHQGRVPSLQLVFTECQCGARLRNERYP